MTSPEYVGRHRRRITMSDEFIDRMKTKRIGKHRREVAS